MDAKEFLLQHLTEGKSYKDIVNCESNSTTLQQLQDWWKSEIELRTYIKRANQLFNARKGKIEFIEFEKNGRRSFVEWFLIQDKTCYYCGIEEYKLALIFGENGIKTKRNRGSKLELERKDANSNQYSPTNCVLACYVCNNHKSDLISEKDNVKYFSKSIFNYLNDKYTEFDDKR